MHIQHLKGSQCTNQAEYSICVILTELEGCLAEWLDGAASPHAKGSQDRHVQDKMCRLDMMCAAQRMSMER